MTTTWDQLPEAFRCRAAVLMTPPALRRWQDAFAHEHEPPIALRWNGTGPMPEAMVHQLASKGMQPRGMTWFDKGLHCDAGDRTVIRALPEHAQGMLVLQSASSMYAALMLGAEPGEDVLDLCAAPGGKTALLHNVMEGRGRLVANDLSRRRVARLRDQLTSLHVNDVQIMCGDGVALARDLPACFDRVLLDAPCSGEGRWHAGQPQAWANWTQSTVRGLAKRQRALLKAACTMVRPGGVVVYATCTLAPEENEGVVAAVCKQGDMQLEPIPRPSPAMQPGLQTWNETDYPAGMDGTCRIMPWCDGCTGFFVAKLRRH